jgi:hypothetical protein
LYILIKFLVNNKINNKELRKNMQNTSKKTKLNKEYIIQAGEMPMVSGKVKPNSDKGEIRFYEKDGLLNFEWKNTIKNISTEPLVIFEGEWEWVKVQTQKGRVYKLQNKTFQEDQFFYWMQNPNKSEDELNETIINNILNTGKLEINENPKEQEDSGIESIIKREDNSNQAVPNQNQNSNMDFIKNFANSINMAKRKYICIYLNHYF